MNRRSFIRLVGGGMVLGAASGLVGCSAQLPDIAIAPWKGPTAEAEPRRWILSYAILAPHAHNLQSWIADLRVPDEITLYCDPARLLPDTDPIGRQIMISQGTFLELLVIAAKERGLAAEVTLFPNGEFNPLQTSTQPTARIRLQKAANLNTDPLFKQIVRRHTNREAYSPVPVPASAMTAIAETVADFDTRVGFIDSRTPDLLARHRRIALDAFRIELVTPRTMMESLRVMRVGPAEIAEHRDGISLNKLMPRAMVAIGLFDRTKAPAADDAAITTQLADFQTNLNSTNAFFWLSTTNNTRATQVNAGRAYVRAQLAATALGLSMHPLSQALQEYPEQASEYRKIHNLVGASARAETVQMWTRLGYGPAVEHSPRRGLAAHLRSA
jgi:hypothetical protein